MRKLKSEYLLKVASVNQNYGSLHEDLPLRFPEYNFVSDLLFTEYTLVSILHNLLSWLPSNKDSDCYCFVLCILFEKTRKKRMKLLKAGILRRF